MKKVALIGGSFDPIHMGHLNMAHAALDQLGADEVWFIPSQSTPLKDRVLTDASHRLAMVRLAANLDPRFKVNPVDLKRSGKSYTVDTLEILKHDYPDTEFVWLIGADQAEQFDQWKDPDRLLELADFVCVERSGNPPRNNPYHLKEIEMEPTPVSSSEIRMGNKLNYVPEPVLQYILDNDLYLLWWVKSRVSDRRFAHSVSVARLCRQLAEAHGLDAHKAWLAGLFHDVCKDMPVKELRKWVASICPECLDEAHAIWHGYAASEVVDKVFGITDPQIKNAIYNHVKGSSFDPYARIVFIADKLDPLRGYDSSGLIKACMHDLYNGFMLVKKENKEYLEKEQKGKSGQSPAEDDSAGELPPAFDEDDALEYEEELAEPGSSRMPVFREGILIPGTGTSAPAAVRTSRFAEDAATSAGSGSWKKYVMQSERDYLSRSNAPFHHEASQKTENMPWLRQPLPQQASGYRSGMDEQVLQPAKTHTMVYQDSEAQKLQAANAKNLARNPHLLYSLVNLPGASARTDQQPSLNSLDADSDLHAANTEASGLMNAKASLNGIPVSSLAAQPAGKGSEGVQKTEGLQGIKGLQETKGSEGFSAVDSSIAYDDSYLHRYDHLNLPNHQDAPRNAAMRNRPVSGPVFVREEDAADAVPEKPASQMAEHPSLPYVQNDAAAEIHTASLSPAAAEHAAAAKDEFGLKPIASQEHHQTLLEQDQGSLPDLASFLKQEREPLSLVQHHQQAIQPLTEEDSPRLNADTKKDGAAGIHHSYYKGDHHHKDTHLTDENPSASDERQIIFGHNPSASPAQQESLANTEDDLHGMKADLPKADMDQNQTKSEADQTWTEMYEQEKALLEQEEADNLEQLAAMEDELQDRRQVLRQMDEALEQDEKEHGLPAPSDWDAVRHAFLQEEPDLDEDLERLEQEQDQEAAKEAVDLQQEEQRLEDQIRQAETSADVRKDFQPEESQISLQVPPTNELTDDLQVERNDPADWTALPDGNPGFDPLPQSDVFDQPSDYGFASYEQPDDPDSDLYQSGFEQSNHPQPADEFSEAQSLVQAAIEQEREQESEFVREILEEEESEEAVIEATLDAAFEEAAEREQEQLLEEAVNDEFSLALQGVSGLHSGPAFTARQDEDPVPWRIPGRDVPAGSPIEINLQPVQPAHEPTSWERYIEEVERREAERSPVSLQAKPSVTILEDDEGNIVIIDEDH